MSWPNNLEFCIVDFETTGLYVQYGDRVVEYAYIVVKNGHIIERGESLVNPNRLMNPEATAKNRITDDMLIGKPPFNQVGGELWNAINGRIFVAHNARFDLSCLAYECRKVGWKQPDFNAIDSIKLSRHFWTGQSSYNLETLANLVGHKWSGEAHRAMADVKALFSVMNVLFHQFPSRLNSLNEILNIGGIEKTEVKVLSKVNMSKKAQILQQNIGMAINIQYQSNSTGLTNRLITPRDLFANNDAEFVSATCHNSMTIKTFRLDRMNLL